MWDPSFWGPLQCCHVAAWHLLNTKGLSSLRPGVLQSFCSLPHHWIQLSKCLFWWLSKLQSGCPGVLSMWCPVLPPLYHSHAGHWCQKLGLVLIQKNNCWILMGFVWCVSGLILWVNDIKIPCYVAVIIGQQWLTRSCLWLWQCLGAVCGWERLRGVLAWAGPVPHRHSREQSWYDEQGSSWSCNYWFGGFAG